MVAQWAAGGQNRSVARSGTLITMIFLAITPKGLADALASAREDDHIWCGRDAVCDEQRDEIFRMKVTIFSYAFTGQNAYEDIQRSVSTMEHHHPEHTVWVEQIPTD